MLKWLLGVPKRYCEAKAAEFQQSADFFHEYYGFDRDSLGYTRGEWAQALANFWRTVAEALPPRP